jgi:hypothetical protein
MARVAMDSLKFHPGPPGLTLVHPAGASSLKRGVRGGPPAGRMACGGLLPLWTPHAIHLCFRHCPHSQNCRYCRYCSRCRCRPLQAAGTWRPHHRAKPNVAILRNHLRFILSDSLCKEQIVWIEPNLSMKCRKRLRIEK